MSPTSPGPVLVTGASGMIGSNLALACQNRGWQVWGTFHTTPVSLEGCATARLSLDDPAAVGDAVTTWKVETIIHCAASVELSALEADPTMVAANVRTTAVTVEAAERGGCRYVLVSSDWVFPGTIPPDDCYQEDDPRGPVNGYGRSKAASEEVVEASGTEWLITRPANVYGINWSVPVKPENRADHVRGRSSLALRWLGRLSRREPLAVPEGVRQSPTSAWSYAERVADLIELGATGAVNAAGPEAMERADYVRRLAGAFDLDVSLVHTVPVGEALQADGESAGLPLPVNTALCDDRMRALTQPLCDTNEGLDLMRRQLEKVAVSL
jgi:dTDP-4-dehydrorhamnose reductase